MAKMVPDAVMDFAFVPDIAMNQVMVCAGQPTSYADAATRALATGSLDSAPTVGAGTPDGRAATYPAKSGITISISGTGDHVVYRDTVNSRYIVTTCSSTSLVAGGGNQVSVGSCVRRVGAAA